MTLPSAGSAFGYDILSYNYHVAAAAAAAASHNSLNGSTQSLSSQKSDRSSSGRDSRSERERRDSTSRDGRSMYTNQVDHDKPPFSRVFVVCSKSHSSDDIKTAFEKYGTVEDVWVVKDKHTKESRGVAYVKFSKMSEACLAVESMDGQKINIENDSKPLKVIIAQPKSSKSTEDFNDESALTRLFVVIPKGIEEMDVRKAFESYGEVEYVQIVKDRRTGEKKGFGYVKYNRAYEAALAVENCDKCYKAVMADPKPTKSRKETTESANFFPGNPLPGISNGIDLAMSLPGSNRNPTELSNQLGFTIGSSDGGRNSNSIGNRLQVQVSPSITQEQLARLFDLIPGMELCDVKKNFSTGESKGIAVVVYNSVGSAIYAKEKLNGFEYPPGCKLIVRYAPDEEENLILPPRVPQIEIPQQSQLLYCSVPLPSPKPMSDSDNCVERLFIVCHPSPPPESVLKDIFSRFGDLIDVYLLKNKNFGYAKFSKAEAAEKAIRVLHGAEVMGKRLKVLQAEPPKGNETSRKRPRT